MSDRSKELLKKLPLSTRQRRLYAANVREMEPRQLEEANSNLEAALQRAPRALASAQAALRERENRAGQRPKRVVFVSPDESEVGPVLDEYLDALRSRFDVHRWSAEHWKRDVEVELAECDLIVCDYSMPSISGRELLNKLQQSGVVATMPTIVFTSDASAFGHVAAMHLTPFQIGTAPTFLLDVASSAIEEPDFEDDATETSEEKQSSTE